MRQWAHGEGHILGSPSILHKSKNIGLKVTNDNKPQVSLQLLRGGCAKQ